MNHMLSPLSYFEERQAAHTDGCKHLCKRLHVNAFDLLHWAAGLTYDIRCRGGWHHGASEFGSIVSQERQTRNGPIAAARDQGPMKISSFDQVLPHDSAKLDPSWGKAISGRRPWTEHWLQTIAQKVYTTAPSPRHCWASPSV